MSPPSSEGRHPVERPILKEGTVSIYFFLPIKTDKRDKRTRILMHIPELIIFPVNKKKKKMVAKATAANNVLYGNSHKRKYGVLGYCLRSFN